jgi:hypothetical protein
MERPDWLTIEGGFLFAQRILWYKGPLDPWGVIKRFAIRADA